MSLLVWTTKSTRNLAGALTAVGHPVSDRTVARMLASLGFSLQGNAKTTEGSQRKGVWPEPLLVLFVPDPGLPDLDRSGRHGCAPWRRHG